MLTLPDFREKKIIFVHAEKDIDQQIRFFNGNVRMYKEGKFTDQISIYLVLCIFIIGNTSITTSLIDKAKKYGISIFLLNYSLKCYAEIMACAEGNTNLRIKQYSTTLENDLESAKKIVENKISNQMLSIQKGSDFISTIANVKNVKELLGIEGNYSAVYYKNIFGTYGWNRRAPRTREDIINLLMDIGYTYLFNYTDSILRLFGFDTYKGFYHTLFFQRKSLSCDLMEPMRPLIDKTVIKAYNLKQVDEKDFIFRKGEFAIKPDGKLRSKYSLIFFEAITGKKEFIYDYLRKYYLHVMNPVHYEFPIYKDI